MYYNFQFMKKYKDQFEIISLISRGTSGQVFKVRKKSSNRIYAMKICENMNLVLREKIERQAKIMSILQSPYALKFIESFYDQFENSYCIVTEYMRNGDLKGLIQKQQFKINNNQILSFVMQISLAFIQLNTKNIVHRDLKPANILIGEDGSYILCDFGCSKFIQGEGFKLLKISSPFGTQLYNSPEIHFGQKGANYNKNVDVWPLGIILYQILYKDYPMQTKDNCLVTEDVELIFEGTKPIKFKNLANIDERIIDLIKKMLAIKFENRINWVGILEYITKQFDYIIYKLEQLLDHQIYFTKLLCLLIYHLNNEKNSKLFLEIDSNHKFTILTNCLIIYQHDILKQTEQILKKSKKPRYQYVILPHVYGQFTITQKTEDFFKMKQKSKKFKNHIKQEYPIEKLELQIQKCCLDLLKSPVIKQKLDNKLYELIKLLSTLRKSFIVKNINYVQKLFNSFI